jgi:hypothetical protein
MEVPNADKPSRGILRRLLVNRFIDLRFTAIWLAMVAAGAYVVSMFEPRFSFPVAFLIVAVAMILVGTSTYFDD